MKTLLAILLFAPLGSSLAADLPAEPPAAELPTQHTVAPKDTLWDLAGRYYHDHFKWRYIAEANPAPKVNDPHWIYPNQVLRIPALEESTAKPANPEEVEPTEQPEQVQQTPEETPSIQAPPKPIEKPRRVRGPERQGSVGGEGISEDFPPGDTLPSAYPFAGRFKAKRGWKADGTIAEDTRDGEHTASEGDIVEIVLHKKTQVSKGEEYSVFRRAAALDTEPDQNALYLMRVGRLQIQAAEGDGKSGRFKAAVVESSDSIQTGDWVKRGE